MIPQRQHKGRGNLVWRRALVAAKIYVRMERKGFITPKRVEMGYKLLSDSPERLLDQALAVASMCKNSKITVAKREE